MITLRGRATLPSVLEQAEIGKARLLIAATDSETSNLAIAMIGKQLGAKRTIARISNPEFLDTRRIDMQQLGIDALVSPETLVSEEILQLVKRSAAFETLDFENGQLTLIGVLLEPGARVVDRSAEDVAAEVQDLHFLNVAISRGGEAIIPGATPCSVPATRPTSSPGRRAWTRSPAHRQQAAGHPQHHGAGWKPDGVLAARSSAAPTT